MVFPSSKLIEGGPLVAVSHIQSRRVTVGLKVQFRAPIKLPDVCMEHKGAPLPMQCCHLFAQVDAKGAPYSQLFNMGPPYNECGFTPSVCITQWVWVSMLLTDITPKSSSGTSSSCCHTL
ncbi:hypothetical protein JTE90_001203 [Oedothorax gibbosus]|uniref:Uncharacterized protein n=1 Tax=Oedothorax gibbosus TaxID=931172 RepID=A0AAV6UUH1_9ARAC|nr:hypothetical protein JTE90_001203 [Oedothorax gibbosus]